VTQEKRKEDVQSRPVIQGSESWTCRAVAIQSSQGRECGDGGPSRTRGARCTAFARNEVYRARVRRRRISRAAQHLAEFIGRVLMTGNAAIVKEVPGMWRTSRAS